MKKTWYQGLLQTHRKPVALHGRHKGQHSFLYENYVLPYLKSYSNLRVLDFGCGKGHYIHYVSDKKLASIAIGIEFYDNNLKSMTRESCDSQIDILKSTIMSGGLFDVVVLDNVLNSIDSFVAEKSVLITCNAFLKKNGILFCSGRVRENKDMVLKNGFTIRTINGISIYQKFHYEYEIQELLHKFNFLDVIYHKINLGSFQIVCKKYSNLDLAVMQSAIDFEFDLPLPNGESYQRNEEIWQVLFNEYRKKENQ